MGDSLRAQVLAKMFYPLGFIVVILGRAQLFTENTLYPVALVLAERKHFWATMRLWFTVLPANVLGALAFAALASLTAALDPHILRSLAHLGVEATQRDGAAIFWSGVMGGWIIATAAWLGFGIALDLGVDPDYLDSDVCGGAGKLCALRGRSG